MQSSMPRLPAYPTQDGYQYTGPSASGGAPSSQGTPPSGDLGDSRKKLSRRNRKKDDKPRKKPKSVLMPSPIEEPKQRSGIDDSIEVTFAMGASTTATDPVIEKRPAAKTTRSATDG
jgi:hypothetical protein